MCLNNLAVNLHIFYELETLLKDNTSIQTLNLNQNQIGRLDYEIIQESIARNRQLRTQLIRESLCRIVSKKKNFDPLILKCMIYPMLDPSLENKMNFE